MIVTAEKRDSLERIVKQAEKDSQMIFIDTGFRGFTQYEKAFCAAYTTIESGMTDFASISASLLIGVQNGDFDHEQSAKVLTFLFGKGEVV